MKNSEEKTDTAFLIGIDPETGEATAFGSCEDAWASGAKDLTVVEAETEEEALAKFKEAQGL